MVEVKGGFVEGGRMDDGCGTVAQDREEAVVTGGMSLSACLLEEGSGID